MAEKRTADGWKKKTEYNIKYRKEHIKRVPFDVPIAKYEEIKKESERLNESVNGYIKKAIDERLKTGK